ncbi:hypothetical protein LMG26684_04191 [Achromobacter mucicolens]|nr:hypothetical protein LMG26684_04191 [Achromobacter mucicolens]
MKMRTRRISNALLLSPQDLGRDPGAGFLLFGYYPFNHSKGFRLRLARRRLRTGKRARG